MADLDMEIIQKNKCGSRLSLAGYLYIKKRTTKYSIQWECTKHHGFNCKGKASTDLQA